MRFEEALKALRDGKRVSRESDGHTLLVMLADKTGKLLHISGSDRMTKGRFSWVPTQADVLAEDWKSED